MTVGVEGVVSRKGGNESLDLQIPADYWPVSERPIVDGLNVEFRCLQRVERARYIVSLRGYQGENSGMEKQIRYPIRRETWRTSRGTGHRTNTRLRCQPLSDPVSWIR